MVKQGGKWVETDWAAALDYVSFALRDVAATSGADSIGALLSPQGIEVQYTSPQEFAAYIHSEIVRNAKLLEAAGVKVE